MVANGKKSTPTPSRGNFALGVGCLALFALPFAGFGAFMTGMAVRELWQWRAMQSWVETPATLIEADLKETHDGDGGSTDQVTARYRYEFRGKAYQGDRVSLHGGSDNIGSYQRDRARELERIEAGAKRLPCYVDPANPAQAVLFRDLRPGLLAMKLVFGLVFGGVGFGLLVGAVAGWRIERRQARRAEKAPDDPWLWRDDWATGRIRSNTAAAAWFTTIFATFWNLVSFPTFFLAWSSVVGDKRGALWLAALFPAVGTGLAASAGYLWLRWLRWGRSEFEMAAVPGVLGGPLAGLIHVPTRVAVRDGFLVRLACVRTIDHPRGGESSPREITLWDHEYDIVRDLAAGDRTVIPVEFVIPFDLPPSGDDVKWKLSAQAETRGVDFYAEFETPVFQTAASSASAGGVAASPTLSATIGFGAAVRAMGARLIDDAASQHTVVFPLGRNPGLAAFLALFAFAWTGMCFGLYVSQIPRVFLAVCSFFELLIVPAALARCLGRTRLEFSPAGVAVQGGVFGLGRRREFKAADVADVAVEKSGMTWGNTVYRKVVLKTVDHNRRTLVSEIARPVHAERLAEEIRRTLGLARKRSDEQSSRMSLESALPAELAGE